MEKTNKVIVEGELFKLVEFTEDKEDVVIVLEVAGVNIWDWFKDNEKRKVRIILEGIG